MRKRKRAEHQICCSSSQHAEYMQKRAGKKVYNLIEIRDDDAPLLVGTPELQSFFLCCSCSVDYLKKKCVFFGSRCCAYGFRANRPIRPVCCCDRDFFFFFRCSLWATVDAFTSVIFFLLIFFTRFC